jgi:hypothetical protein
MYIVSPSCSTNPVSLPPRRAPTEMQLRHWVAGKNLKRDDAKPFVAQVKSSRENRGYSPYSAVELLAAGATTGYPQPPVHPQAADVAGYVIRSALV